MKVIVHEARGLVGRKVVDALRRRQHEIIAAAADTETDSKKLALALAGVKIVIDAPDPPASVTTNSVRVLKKRCQRLLSAASAARVHHFIALSEVGADRDLEGAYWRAQRARESVIEASSVPHTILRATQMFEFMDWTDRSVLSGQTLRVPPACIQPIVSDEVAAALADLVLGPPRNGALEMGGPERLRLDHVIRRLFRISGNTRLVLTDEHARYLGAEVGGDDLMPSDEAIVGVTRFEDWLGSRAIQA